MLHRHANGATQGPKLPSLEFPLLIGVSRRWPRFFSSVPMLYAPPVLLIGLTGGIGSGKSTVAALLEARGALIVDADAIAREVVEPGSPTLALLVERFGPEILGPDGALDRSALANIAFASSELRKELEAITHPAIGEVFFKRLAEAPTDAVVVHDVPLLAESAGALARGYGAIVVVETPKELRLLRLDGRGIPRADAEARMAAQATDEERREIATHVIDNQGDHETLEYLVDGLWNDLLILRDENAALAAQVEELAP
jgi:dephospho-CoA kinase